MIPHFWTNIENARLLDEVYTINSFDGPGYTFGKAIKCYFKSYHHPYVRVFLSPDQTREIVMSPKSILRIVRPHTEEVIYEKDPRSIVLGGNYNGV